MPKKQLIVIAGVLLALLSLFYFVTSGSPEHKTDAVFTSLESLSKDPEQQLFHILVLAPLGGAESSYGRSAYLGAKAAEAVVNEDGGILGKRLAVHIYDTRSSEEVSLQIISAFQSHKELLNISAIVDASSDNIIRTNISALKKDPEPYFYVRSGQCKTVIEPDDKKPANFVWGLGLSPQSSIEPLLIALADKLSMPEREFSMYLIGGESEQIHSNNTFVRSTAEGLSFKIFDEKYYDLRLQDYYSVIRDIITLHPDLLYIDNPGIPGRYFMEQAAQLSLERDIVIAGMETFEEEGPKEIAANSHGVYTVSSYIDTLNSPTNRRFLDAIQKVKKTEDIWPPTTLMASVYSSVLIIREGYQKAGSDELSKFSSAMADLEINTPNGRVLVSSENHLLIQPIFTIQIKQGKRELVEALGDAAHPRLDYCSAAIS